MSLLKNMTHFPEGSNVCPSDNEPPVRSTCAHTTNLRLLCQYRKCLRTTIADDLHEDIAV